MIKFFRKIRQKLIAENRFSKYLIYAIGEIILVVLGILIALQINTWNQDKINKKAEQKYYARFLEDVILDDEIIQTQKDLTKQRLSSANDMIRLLQQEKIDMNELAKSVANSVSQSDFGLRPTQTTYEEIKSSGHVQLLKDPDIKKQLDDYYAFMTGLMKIISNNASRLSVRMLDKKDVIGTGFLYLSLSQDGLDSSKVDKSKLLHMSKLTPENTTLLINDAVYYSGITSRNLYHFSKLQERVNAMKQVLIQKVNATHD